jgi:FMN reductase (NADPH)/FMN reductase [NAD(P)H]
VSGVEELCEQEGKAMRTPEEGDLFLACCDALIAAQTAVVAAESLGLGSCYIGDIMENYEEHRELFDLPQYVFPICLLCFGYPTRQQRERALTRRLDTEYVVFEDRYRRFEPEEHEEMYRDRQQEPVYGQQRPALGAKNLAQLTYTRKFDSDFAREMNRSVRAMLQAWVGE